MTNAESKQQYEGARKAELSQSSRSTTICAMRCLQQLIKNSERLVTIENKLDRIDDLENKINYIYSSIKWIVGLLGAVLIAVLANLLNQPIASLLY